MISPAIGEIEFLDGLRFAPHIPLAAEHLGQAKRHRHLRVPGWTHHHLGAHPSDRGEFETNAISDEASRIQAVFLQHRHEFYEAGTFEDSERRAFHEEVLHSDVRGQREFSWGEVFRSFDRRSGSDWIIVIYAAGPHVPAHRGEILRCLEERHPLPGIVPSNFL